MAAILAYKEQLRNWAIRKLGGYDQVSTSFLIYRANQLASLVQESHRDPGLVKADIRAIRAATIKLDREYAERLGYL